MEAQGVRTARWVVAPEKASGLAKSQRPDQEVGGGSKAGQGEGSQSRGSQPSSN